MVDRGLELAWIYSGLQALSLPPHLCPSITCTWNFQTSNQPPTATNPAHTATQVMPVSRYSRNKTSLQEFAFKSMIVQCFKVLLSSTELISHLMNALCLPV